MWRAVIGQGRNSRLASFLQIDREFFLFLKNSLFFSPERFGKK